MTLVRLEELAQWGQQIMDRMGWQDGDSRRVTWTPKPRLIRYYTTLGLLDRATQFQGRVAYYSGKHLLQILAIKYLQTQGKTLEEIQPLILGLSETSLAEMLGLRLPLPEPQLHSGPKPEIVPRRESFWQELPQRSEEPRISARGPLPQRLLQSYQPIPGIQILVDSAELPEGFALARFLQSVHHWTQSKGLESDTNDNKGGATP